jgi:pimeloyl-ACP methyl ester carboxylesterase
MEERAVATYVLVHGGWSGAHCFHLVRPCLWREGHQVFTPSLTGIGERAHLVSPQISLSTHVRDVVNTVLYEDLEEIVLLGFSYGGLVVTGALQHIADRVRHLVFLDAFVPTDGQSLFDLAGRAASQEIEVGEQWLVPPPAREFDDPSEAEFANKRRTPHPIACFTQPVALSKPLESFSFTRTYVKATEDAPDAPGAAAFWAAARHAQSSPHWRYHEIGTNHMVPHNRPEQLSLLLLDLARL